MCTHESYLARVVELAKARPTLSDADRAKLEAIKVVYGTGPAGTRGVTYYNLWTNGHAEPYPLIEICAGGEESDVQLAGTMLHELAHVLAGYGAGHGPEWKAACERLGLRKARAAGHCYRLAGFDPAVRFPLVLGPKPTDGAPAMATRRAGLGLPTVRRPKPCGAGIGVRGGKSRGVGSGSRMLKVTCSECGYVARVSRAWLAVGPPHCGAGHGPMQEG